MELDKMNISEKFLFVSLGLDICSKDSTIFLISMAGYADKFNRVKLSKSFFRKLRLSNKRIKALKDMIDILVINNVLRHVEEDVYQINTLLSSNDYLNELSKKELEENNIFSEEIPNTFFDRDGKVLFSLEEISNRLDDLF